MQDKTGELHPVTTPLQLYEAAKKGWPVFTKGEILTIKGGSFRIRSLGRKCMVLEGVPGTSIEVGKNEKP